MNKPKNLKLRLTILSVWRGFEPLLCRFPSVEDQAAERRKIFLVFLPKYAITAFDRNQKRRLCAREGGAAISDLLFQLQIGGATHVKRTNISHAEQTSIFFYRGAFRIPFPAVRGFFRRVGEQGRRRRAS